MLAGTNRPGGSSRLGVTAPKSGRNWKSQVEDTLRKASECREWVTTLFANCAEFMEWDEQLGSAMESRLIQTLVNSNREWNKLLASAILKPIASLASLEDLENLCKETRWNVNKEEENLATEGAQLLSRIKSVRVAIKGMFSGEFSKQAPHREFEIAILVLLQVFRMGTTVPELQQLKDYVEQYRRADSLISNTTLTIEQLSTLIDHTSTAETSKSLSSSKTTLDFSFLRINDAGFSGIAFFNLAKDEIIQNNMRERLRVGLKVQDQLSALLDLSALDVSDFCSLCHLIEESSQLRFTFDHMKQILQLRDSFNWLTRLDAFLTHLESNHGIDLSQSTTSDHLLASSNPQTFDRQRALSYLQMQQSGWQPQTTPSGSSPSRLVCLRTLTVRVLHFAHLLHQPEDNDLVSVLLMPTKQWQLIDPSVSTVMEGLRIGQTLGKVRHQLLQGYCSLDNLTTLEMDVNKLIQQEHVLESVWGLGLAPLANWLRGEREAGQLAVTQAQGLAADIKVFVSTLDENSVAFTDNQANIKAYKNKFEMLVNKVQGGSKSKDSSEVGSVGGGLVSFKAILDCKPFRSCRALLGLLQCASSLGLRGTISRTELNDLEPFLHIEEYQQLRSHPMVGTILETRNQLRIYEELLAILFQHQSELEPEETQLTDGQARESRDTSQGLVNVPRHKEKPRLQIKQVREHLSQMSSPHCVIDYSREVQIVTAKVRLFEEFEAKAAVYAKKGPLSEEFFISERVRTDVSDTETESVLSLRDAWEFYSNTSAEVKVVLDGLTSSPFFADSEKSIQALEWALECLGWWLEADSRWSSTCLETKKPTLGPAESPNQADDLMQEEEMDYVLARRRSEGGSHDGSISQGLTKTHPLESVRRSREDWVALLTRGVLHKDLQPAVHRLVQAELEASEQLESRCQICFMENVQYKTLLELEPQLKRLKVSIDSEVGFFWQRLSEANQLAQRIDAVVVGKQTRFRLKDLDNLVLKVKSSGICFDERSSKLEAVVAFCHAFEKTLKTFKKSAIEVKKAKKTYESIPLISSTFDGILKQLSGEEGLLDSLEFLLSDETAAEDYDTVNDMLTSLAKVEYYDVSASILKLFKKKCRLILRIHHGISALPEGFNIPLPEIVSMRSFASKHLQILKDAEQEQCLRWNTEASSRTKSTADSVSNVEGFESLDVIHSFLSDLVRKAKNHLAALESDKQISDKTLAETSSIFMKFIDIKVELCNLKVKLQSNPNKNSETSRAMYEKPKLVPLRESSHPELRTGEKSGQFGLRINVQGPQKTSESSRPLAPNSHSLVRIDRERYNEGPRSGVSAAGGQRAYGTWSTEVSNLQSNQHQHHEDPSRRLHPPLGIGRRLEGYQENHMNNRLTEPGRSLVNRAHDRQQLSSLQEGSYQTSNQQSWRDVAGHTGGTDIHGLRQHNTALFRSSLSRNPFLFQSDEGWQGVAKELEKKLFTRFSTVEYGKTCESVARLLERAVGFEKISRLLDLKDFCVELIFILMNKSQLDLARLNSDKILLQRVLEEANTLKAQSKVRHPQPQMASNEDTYRPRRPQPNGNMARLPSQTQAGMMPEALSKRRPASPGREYSGPMRQQHTQSRQQPMPSSLQYRAAHQPDASRHN